MNILHIVKKSLNGAVWMTMSRMLAYVLSAISMIFIARWLGPSQYGYIALVTAIIQIVMIFTDMGLSSSTAYYLSQNRQIPGSLRCIIFKAIRLLSLSTLICLTIFFLLNPRLASFFKAPLLGKTSMSFLMGMLLIIQVSSRWIQKVYEGLGEMALLSKYEIALAWIRPATSLLLVFVGFEVVGVFSGQFFGGAVLIAALIYALKKIFSHINSDVISSSTPKVTYTQIVSYAMPLMMIYVGSLIYLQNSILILKFFRSIEEVSYYGLVMQIIVLSQVPAISFGASVAPQIAVIQKYSKEKASEFVGMSLRYLTITYALIAVFLNIFASSVITVLFSIQYLPSVPILQILTPYIFCFGISGFVSLGLDYAGKAKLRMFLICIAAIVSVLLNLYLVPKHGMRAAAWNNLITYVPLVLIYIYLMAKLYDLSLRHSLLFVLKLFISIAVSAIVMFLIKIHICSEILRLFIGFFMGTGVYSCMLFATRIIKIEDFKRVNRIVHAK